MASSQMIQAMLAKRNSPVEELAALEALEALQALKALLETELDKDLSRTDAGPLERLKDLFKELEDLSCGKEETWLCSG